MPLSPAPRPSAELAALDRIGGRLVCWGEPLYPSALAAVEDAPPVLTLLGRRRAARPAGRRHGRRAQRLGQRPAAARDLAAGLAGPASSSPRAWPAASTPRRIWGARRPAPSAVVAGGADIVYPEENRGLYDALRRQGAIVAELPLGSEPQARHFPRRNRIISGMALGVLVVEAAARSGSLITARFALEQGREVFAVPGSPLDPRCRGANDLLGAARP